MLAFAACRPLVQWLLLQNQECYTSEALLAEGYQTSELKGMHAWLSS
jgi:hypothetical protein